MHLLQIAHVQQGRRVALMEEDLLWLLSPPNTLYELAMEAISREVTLETLAHSHRTQESMAYEPVYSGESAWKCLIPFDHPTEPSRCLVSGTGLTHKASAENRSKMHQKEPSAVTDSMRMYQWGLDSGSPPSGQAGVQPEWFYKGSGRILRAHNEPLTVPSFAGDGGEEPEVAGVYVIGPDGTPFRVGLVTGNEFSDHKMERLNYLYLAPSKLRECAIGPELVTGHPFSDLTGQVSVNRNGTTAWSARIFTGATNMSHTVENLEHHHFKYPEHRQPGDVHIHFFGADAFSFGEGFELAAGDTMIVSWPELGRPLKNPIRFEPAATFAAQRVSILG